VANGTSFNKEEIRQTKEKRKTVKIHPCSEGRAWISTKGKRERERKKKGRCFLKGEEFLGEGNC